MVTQVLEKAAGVRVAGMPPVSAMLAVVDHLLKVSSGLSVQSVRGPSAHRCRVQPPARVSGQLHCAALYCKPTLEQR